MKRRWPQQPWELSLYALSLRMILRPARQRPFVLEHLSKIAAIDPSVAGKSPDEVLGLVRDWLADALAIVSPARNARSVHRFFPLSADPTYSRAVSTASLTYVSRTEISWNSPQWGQLSLSVFAHDFRRLSASISTPVGTGWLVFGHLKRSLGHAVPRHDAAAVAVVSDCHQLA
jgi:hypothetical protein